VISLQNHFMVGKMLFVTL